MIKGRRTNAQLAEFAETVLFKIPKTRINPGKFDDQWADGIFISFDMRSMESLVATPAGVLRVTDVKRRPMDERWSVNNVNNMRGSPKQPVPGQAPRRSPAYSRLHE